MALPFARVAAGAGTALVTAVVTMTHAVAVPRRLRR